MNENETKASNIMITRLMPILLNKLHSNRLKPKELTIATLETDK